MCLLYLFLSRIDYSPVGIQFGKFENQMRNRRYFFIRTFATVKRKSLNRQNKNLSNIYIMNLKSRKTVFITGLCLASLVSGVPLPANASADTTAMIQQQSVKIKGRVTDAS